MVYDDDKSVIIWLAKLPTSEGNGQSFGGGTWRAGNAMNSEQPDDTESI